MTRILIKSQLLQFFSSSFLDKKSGKRKSQISTIIINALTVFTGIMAINAGMLKISKELILPLHEYHLEWLYLLMISFLAIIVGTMISIFSTQEVVFAPKDNDLLLALPVPVRSIIASRLSYIYIIGGTISTLIMIPGLIIYYFNVQISVKSIVASVSLVVIVSILVLMFATIGGWACAAFISSNSNKNKKLTNAIMTFGSLAVYYYLFVKITEIFGQVMDNAGGLGEKVQSSNQLIYLIGRAISGDIGLLIIIWIVVIAVAMFLFIIFEKKYLGYITRQNAREAKAFDVGQIKAKSLTTALLFKEFKRYLSCGNYILNCSFGTVFMMVLSVFMLFEGNDIFKLIELMIDSEINYVPILNISLICIMISLNTITAPSISLEGRNLWILKSLPVSEWTIIKNKIKLHYIITIVPVLLFDVELLVLAKLDLYVSVMTILITMLYPLFTAGLGLFINLMKPKLNWTNESAVTRLNMGIIAAMVIGGAIPVIIMMGSIKIIYSYQIENATKPLMISFLLLETFAVAGMLVLLKTVGVKKLRKIY
ncbi:MAG: hypothetical protein K6G88_09520 [Lachnospiraceae bacterium]|nr:hypothetical protein [Lachnospiraceae bacterium]